MLTALPLPLLREIFLAVFVAVPVCGAAGALLAVARHRRPAAPAVAPTGANGRATTRRAFIKYGAAGVTTLAGGSVVASRLLTDEARATGETCTVCLTINQGYVRMVDGTSVFMRGFGFIGRPQVPGPAIGPAGAAEGEIVSVTEGDTVTIRVRNNLAETRNIVIEDPLTGTNLFDSGPIPPTAADADLQTLASFTPTRAGTYIYRDSDLVQSLLGLHGVMVVMPKDRPKTLYGVDRENDGDDGLPEAPTFASQYCWVLHDVDPLWGAIAADQVARGQPVAIDGRTFFPRYFTINGSSGGNAPTDSTNDRRTVPARHLDSSALIRIVNCGGVVHSCHFHGNHVFVYTDNHRAPFRTDPVIGKDPVTGAETILEPAHPVAPQKDVLRMDPLSTKDVLLPCHEPLDQYPPYDPNTAFLNVYPMHCHAEMSQTAGGGNYPSGMLSDWELLTEPERGPRPLGCSRC